MLDPARRALADHLGRLGGNLAGLAEQLRKAVAGRSAALLPTPSARRSPSCSASPGKLLRSPPIRSATTTSQCPAGATPAAMTAGTSVARTAGTATPDL